MSLTKLFKIFIRIFLFTFSLSIFSGEKPLRIAVSKGSAPFFYVDENDEPIGILIDYWKMWSEKSGIEIVFQPYSWGDTIKAIKEGKADIHGGIYYSKKRDEFLDYAYPIVDNTTHFFYNRKLPTVTRESDFVPYLVGIIAGDYSLEVLQKEYPFLTPRVYKSNKDLFDGIESGEVQVFIKDTPIALHHLKKRNLLQKFTYFVARPVYFTAFQAAVKSGNDKVLSLLKAKKGSVTQEELLKIYRKWVVGAAPTKTKMPLVISLPAHSAPLVTSNSLGEPSGLIVDLWKIWAEQSDYKIKFYFTDWNSSLDAIKKGVADIHGALLDPEIVGEWGNVTTPIYKLYGGVYFSKHQYLKAPRLTNGVIGVVEGLISQKKLAKIFPDLTIKSFRDLDEVYNAVEKRDINFFFHEEVMTNRFLSEKGIGSAYKIINETRVELFLYGCASNSKDKLVKSINDSLNRVSINTIHELEKKWLPHKQFYSTNAKISKLDLTIRDRDWLQKNPVINVACSTNSSPFLFKDPDTGKIVGLYRDYMDLVSNKIGVKFELLSASGIEKSFKALDKGKADIVFGVEQTSKHLKKVNFTRPFLQLDRGILAHENTALVSTIPDMKGVKVAVLKGDLILQKLESEGVNFVTVNNSYDGIKLLSEKRVDYFIDSLPVLSSYVKQLNLQDFKLAGTLRGREGHKLISVAVRKDWPTMVSILNSALKDVSAVEHQELRKKWFSLRPVHIGEYSSFSVGVITYGVPIVVVVFVALVYTRLLSKERQRFKLGHEELAKFKDIVDSCGSLILITNVKGEIIYGNPKLSEISGYSESELLQRSPAIFKHEKNDNDVHQQLMESVSSGESWEGTLYGMKKDGNEFTAFTKVIPFKDKYGIIASYIAIGEDISKIVDLKQELKQSELFIETLPIPAVRFNMAGFIVNANDCARRIFENKLEIDQHISSLNEMYDYEIWERVINSNVAIRQDLTLNGKNYLFSWLSSSDSNQVYVFGLDISEQKKLEEALISLRRKIDQTNRTEVQFLENIGHEITSPMNAIVGMAYLLEQSSLNDKQLNFISRIREAAKSLIRVINGILDFSQVESGQLAVEDQEFSLSDLMDKLGEVISYKAADKNLELVFSKGNGVDDFYVGDVKKISQILINLLNNAVKFTPAGYVKLSISKVEEHGRTHVLNFEVSDSGVGLSEEDQDTVFNSFVKLDYHSKDKSDGTGLGLAISKKLTEFMGGDIRLHSQKGRGTKFSVHLELQQSSSENICYERLLDECECLIVSDKILTQAEIVRACQQLGASVKTIQTADLETYRGFSGDLAIIDCRYNQGFIKNLKLKAKKLLFLSSVPCQLDMFLTEFPHNVAVSTFQPVMFTKIYEAVRLLKEKANESSSLGTRVAAFNQEKVLIVEDDELNRQVISELLKSLHLTPVIAENGAVAIDKLYKYSDVSLIFMDMQMPVMDGVEAAGRIRSVPEFQNIPIVALTGKTLKSEHQEAYLAGVNEVLVKPVDSSSVSSVVLRWLKVAKYLDTGFLDYSSCGDFVHFNKGLMQSAGNKEGYEKALAKFISRLMVFVKGDLDLLTLSIEEVKKELHLLKGVAANLGAVKIYDKVMLLEKKCTISEKLTADLIDSFIEDCRLTVNEVSAVLNVDSSEKLRIAGVDLKAQLAKLLALVKESDTAAVGLMDEIESSFNNEKEMQKLIENTKAAISNYDFIAAVPLVEKLISKYQEV